MLKELLMKAVDKYGEWSRNREIVDQVLQMNPQDAVRFLQQEIGYILPAGPSPGVLTTGGHEPDG